MRLLTFVPRSRQTARSRAHRARAERQREKREIPAELVPRLADVVDPKDVVVDDSFNEVEATPADEHPADKATSALRPAPLIRTAPEDPDAECTANQVAP